MNDYGVVTAPQTVRIERVLPGPIERVWSYLTDSEKRGSWLASGSNDLRVGGKVDYVFDNSRLTDNDDPPPPKYAEHACVTEFHGRVTACDPPRLLGYTFGGGSEGEPSEVLFELTPRGSDVLLTVTHSKLATRDAMLSVSAGWHTHLGILRDRLEGQVPDGFWRTHTRLETEYAKRIPG